MPAVVPITRTRWPIFFALVLGLSAVGVFWYIVLANPKGEAVPASGGHYTEGVIRASERINPLFAGVNGTDADLAALIFSGLVRLGPDGTPQPDLAERWEITGNGQSYVFHLRQGVQWQDGEAFDAEDVVFTYKAISAPGFKGDSALAQLMQGVIVSARDPLTVEFRLEQAYSPFLAYLTVGILPRHLLASLDQNALFNAPFNAQPVGTGPYALKSRSDDSVVLKPNATYYLGPPHIAVFELKSFSDNGALIAALRSGGIDGALLGANLAPADLVSFRADDRVAVHDITSTSYITVELDTRSPLFSDPSVRRALLESIDRQSLIDSVIAGRGTVVDDSIPTQSWAYAATDRISFDAEAAAAALDAGGWLVGGDGVRRKGGAALSFSLSTANDVQRTAVADNLAYQWRKIGIDAQVQPLTAASFTNDYLLPRKFQAALVAIDPGPDPDPYPFWHSSQITPPGRNLADYSETRIDDVLQRARQTTDVARRKELYAQFEDYLISATPALPLYAPTYTYAQSSRVHGFAPSLLFTPASRFANVTAWFIETRVQ